MTARNEDFLFAQEAVSLGYVTEAQVEEGFELQKRMADELEIEERLAVILVKRGWMAEEQARRVYGIIEPEGARTQIEGYRLVQKVGRGAMGTVYKAIHKGLHRVVAIKILRRELLADKTQIERLRREAKLLADLDHPNIVRAFDAGESNGFPYLVMEYVEGETLRDHITHKGRLGDEEALRITRAVADALEKARRMGIVHRDVKPGNILIGKGGTPKLMDLGLAKGPIDAGLTQHGATVGTPQFMSPEQAESPDKADTRSDIYSLGATLYAMVTGRPPFEGTTLAEVITKVMSQQPVPPRVRNPDVSPEVSHLIERMMLKDASLRYATPALVIEDIDMIRGGQSIIPRGFQGNWEAYLLRKRFLAWRKRILIGAAAVLIVGFGLWAYLKSQAKELGRRSAGQLAADILDGPFDLARADPPEALALVRAALGDARAKRDKIQEISEERGVAFPRRNEIDERIKVLELHEVAIERLGALEQDVRLLKQSGKFARAAQLLEQSTTEFHAVPWARAQWETLRQRVRTDSSRALTAGLTTALGAPDGDLEAFVTKWRAYREVFDAGWYPDEAYTALMGAAEDARRRASQIGTLAGGILASFRDDDLARRASANEFYELREDLRRATEDLARHVGDHERNWPAGPWPTGRTPTLPPFFGNQGIIGSVVERVRDRIDAAADRAYTELEAQVPSMTLAEAIAALQAFANAAERGSSYRELAQRANTLREDLRQRADALQDAQKAAFGVTLQEILRSLRAGDPGGLREAVQHGAEGDRLAADRRALVGGLGVAADALEAVQTAALAYVESQLLAGRASFERVSLRAGRTTFVERKRIVVLRVDHDDVALLLRRGRGGSASDEERVAIRDVHPATLRAWARASERDVAERDLVLVGLAELPEVGDEPGVDLRGRVETYRTALRALEAQDLTAWRHVAGELLHGLADVHQRRCDDANRLLTRLIRLDPFDNPKLLIQYADLLLDPAGRVRYTPEAEKAKNELEQRVALAREELAKDELRRLFYGDIKPKHLPGDEKELLFDFDDEAQLENFERGFAALEAAGASGTTTPRDVEGNLQLLLLPGVDGFLRDRPLSIWNPFDPAQRMAIEFTLHPLRAPALLAFDLDGVQVAICSLDPNVWKRRFRRDAPRLDDETELPEFDFYGMGRGVAFHEGVHFGENFPLGNWDWAVEGQGRNFLRLKDLGYVESQAGGLFAFDPGKKSMRVRVERWGGKVGLWIDGRLVIERERTSWASRGESSPTNERVRNGSGRLQILTWTPIVLDDLRFVGTLTERWKERRKREMQQTGRAEAPK